MVSNLTVDLPKPWSWWKRVSFSKLDCSSFKKKGRSFLGWGLSFSNLLLILSFFLSAGKLPSRKVSFLFLLFLFILVSWKIWRRLLTQRKDTKHANGKLKKKKEKDIFNIKTKFVILLYPIFVSLFLRTACWSELLVQTAADTSCLIASLFFCHSTLKICFCLPLPFYAGFVKCMLQVRHVCCICFLAQSTNEGIKRPLSKLN